MSTESQDNDNDYEPMKFKVIFLGKAGVGKTSIIQRKINGTFDIKMIPTVGAGHHLTEEKIGNRNIELCIWDTAGQEQFHSLIPLYLHDTDLAVIVASLVDEDSIRSLTYWRDLVYEEDERPPIVAVINKIDLQDGAPLSLDSVLEIVLQNFPESIFVSAKNGEGINELFTKVATIISQKSQPPIKTINQNINRSNTKKSSSCC